MKISYIRGTRVKTCVHTRLDERVLLLSASGCFPLIDMINKWRDDSREISSFPYEFLWTGINCAILFLFVMYFFSLNPVFTNFLCVEIWWFLNSYEIFMAPNNFNWSSLRIVFSFMWKLFEWLKLSRKLIHCAL